jgi:pyridinium-3,5-bisthiocarboxylic acid mononucleotide nickel chelatase
MTKIAIIDAQLSGISGDMILASLVNAGANEKKILDGIFASQNFLSGSTIKNASFLRTVTHGFSATCLQLDYSDKSHKRRGTEMYRSLASCCNTLDLEQRAKVLALESLKTMIVAEALIHGKEIDSVFLEETSSVDTFVDLVGCATAIQDLRLFDARIFSTKVAVGGGSVALSHGKVPNPTNAILEIFKGRHFVLEGGQVDEELTTPTGAALLVNLASETITHYPTFIPMKIGYGTGQREIQELPNILRFIIGESSSIVDEAYEDGSCLIETSVDDVSGEVIGNLIEVLSGGIVKDVMVVPGLTKKNRSAYLIRIICDHIDLHAVLEILFKETGTLGARFQEIRRVIVPRSIVTVPVTILDQNFNVRVKINRGLSAVVLGVKPEFDDLKAIASSTGLSLKRTQELVSGQVQNKWDLKDVNGI